MSSLVSRYNHHDLILLPERALWDPATSSLYVADVHLGKAATYRALGQPVPGGTTAENLGRLSHVLAQTNPENLIFLGDLFHARQAYTRELMAQFTAWRQDHASIRMILVRGNHDIRAGNRSETLDLEHANEPLHHGRIIARHYPDENVSTHPLHITLAGHVHPTISLKGTGRQKLRLPCFVVCQNQIILPAFGEFTGGANVALQRNQIALAVVDGHMMKVMP